MSTSSLSLLNLPSDILPLSTKTVPSTVSSKALTFPPILTGVDSLLSEIDVKTESPLDWVLAPEPDHPLITSWNALPEMGTHLLGFTSTTTAISLAETLPTSETNIIVPIPTGWSSATQGLSLNPEVPLRAQGSDQSLSTSYTEINTMVSISTGWSGASQEISLGQEAGSVTYIKPLQAQASEQSLGTPYAHRLSHQQPATATPPPAVDALSRSWQRVSVTRAPANPHNTRLLSSYNQVVHTGGSLSAKTEGETVLVSSSTPPILNQDGRGRLVLPPSSTPSSRSKNLAKTDELSDSGLIGTATARPMKENGKTATPAHGP
ncbi:hypothetical protein ASPFODRAFT_711913 [Aspergillus luchuensis CBS 106.47]|uniref:Uncharacterized protein n=1 Tax=Aspergillus luchuensis (strain CBS 106.47) TaxID=1137211 RepID=A0A1M3SZL1_ASPLC|nr:hypothetical protein ASPFODRAFT_711913 [Aspergillus luchuensis CBS 106.47]